MTPRKSATISLVTASVLIMCTVIPAMVQRLFIAIIMQCDHKYATPPSWKQFYVFLATASTGVLTAGTADSRYIVYLWENKGVAPLRELL